MKLGGQGQGLNQVQGPVQSQECQRVMSRVWSRVKDMELRHGVKSRVRVKGVTSSKGSGAMSAGTLRMNVSGG